MTRIGIWLAAFTVPILLGMNVERTLAFSATYRSGCLYEFALARARSRTRKKFSLSIHREEQRRVLEAIFHFFRSLYNQKDSRS